VEDGEGEGVAFVAAVLGEGVVSATPPGVAVFVGDGPKTIVGTATGVPWGVKRVSPSQVRVIASWRIGGRCTLPVSRS